MDIHGVWELESLKMGNALKGMQKFRVDIVLCDIENATVHTWKYA